MLRATRPPFCTSLLPDKHLNLAKVTTTGEAKSVLRRREMSSLPSDTKVCLLCPVYLLLKMENITAQMPPMMRFWGVELGIPHWTTTREKETTPVSRNPLRRANQRVIPFYSYTVAVVIHVLGGRRGHEVLVYDCGSRGHHELGTSGSGNDSFTRLAQAGKSKRRTGVARTDSACSGRVHVLWG